MQDRPTNGLVLTADVIGSTGTAPGRLEAVLTATARSIEQHLTGGEKIFHFSRGDAFQALLPEPGSGVRVAVLWRAGLICAGLDLRVSLAGGEVAYIGSDPAMSSGEAFLRSGRQLDELKGPGAARMAIAAGEGDAAAYLQDTTLLADAIISEWTAMQAEAVFEMLLRNPTQEQLAHRLSVSQPAVHKRLSGARWSVIEKWIAGCTNLLHRLYPPH